MLFISPQYARLAKGYIWTSTDYGATWTQRTTSGGSPSTPKYWQSITSSSDGTMLAAVYPGIVLLFVLQITYYLYTM